MPHKTVNNILLTWTTNDNNERCGSVSLEQRLDEVEGDLLAGESLVDRGESVRLVLHVRHLRLVELDLNPKVMEKLLRVF